MPTLATLVHRRTGPFARGLFFFLLAATTASAQTVTFTPSGAQVYLSTTYSSARNTLGELMNGRTYAEISGSTGELELINEKPVAISVFLDDESGNPVAEYLAAPMLDQNISKSVDIVKSPFSEIYNLSQNRWRLHTTITATGTQATSLPPSGTLRFVRGTARANAVTAITMVHAVVIASSRYKDAFSTGDVPVSAMKALNQFFIDSALKDAGFVSQVATTLAGGGTMNEKMAAIVSAYGDLVAALIRQKFEEKAGLWPDFIRDANLSEVALRNIFTAIELLAAFEKTGQVVSLASNLTRDLSLGQTLIARQAMARALPAEKLDVRLASAEAWEREALGIISQLRSVASAKSDMNERLGRRLNAGILTLSIEDRFRNAHRLLGLNDPELSGFAADVVPYAYLSDRIYRPAETVDTVENNWKLVRKQQGSIAGPNGFIGGVFVNQLTQEHVVVFGGTTAAMQTASPSLLSALLKSAKVDAIRDIAADIGLANMNGTSDQAATAREFLDSVATQYPQARLKLTGHSLGGGLAQYVALLRGVDAVTFNSAPLPFSTTLRQDIPLQGGRFIHAPRILNVMSNTDPLTGILQLIEEYEGIRKLGLTDPEFDFIRAALNQARQAFGVPDDLALTQLLHGRRVVLPSSTGHSMSPFLQSIQQWALAAEGEQQRQIAALDEAIANANAAIAAGGAYGLGVAGWTEVRDEALTAKAALVAQMLSGKTIFPAADFTGQAPTVTSAKAIGPQGIEVQLSLPDTAFTGPFNFRAGADTPLDVWVTDPGDTISGASRRAQLQVLTQTGQGVRFVVGKLDYDFFVKRTGSYGITVHYRMNDLAYVASADSQRLEASFPIAIDAASVQFTEAITPNRLTVRDPAAANWDSTRAALDLAAGESFTFCFGNPYDGAQGPLLGYRLWLQDASGLQKFLDPAAYDAGTGCGDFTLTHAAGRYLLLRVQARIQGGSGETTVAYGALRDQYVLLSGVVSAAASGGTPGPSVPASRPLNDTGVAFCGAYPDGNLACDGSQPAGQDAHYGRDAAAAAGQLTKVGGGNAGFDFTKIANNGSVLPASAALGEGPTDWACTRDNVTGLLWEVKTTSGLRSQSHSYTWYDSVHNYGGYPGTASGGSCATAGRCDTEKYVADVNAVGLCGQTDWRMPAVWELLGIVDKGRVIPSIDTAYFPNTGTFFWSGSPSAYNRGVAWYVYFKYGGADDINQSFGFLVRLVRGGQ